MSKIKIFVDAHVFDESFQGTTTYIQGIYNSLVKDQRFEITIAANDIDKAKLHFSDPNFKFVKLLSRSKFRRLAIDIPKILKQGGFNFAHFQYITPPVKYCKYINTIHDLLFLDFPELFTLKYRVVKGLTFWLSSLNSDVICTVSNYSKESLVRHFKTSSNKIYITANAAQISTKAEQVKEKYNLDKFVLYVSRFEARKNHLNLHVAFNELKLGSQGYKLVFIGKRFGEENLEYENFANGLSEEDKAAVVYLENISSEELTGFYQSASLFVYPSIAEGFGIPPLEAAINKCKVLCSNQTAMADYDFFGQYQFDPRSIGDLKQKIEFALADDHYPFESIRTQILSRYTWDNIAGSLSEALIKNNN